MQANDPYSFPNWLAPTVFNGLPPLPSNPLPGPLVPAPSDPVGQEAAGHRGPLIPFPPHLNHPQMQGISRWNSTPTVVGKKRRRIGVSFGFQSMIEVQEEQQLVYEAMVGWKEEKKRLNWWLEELKVGKWISDQNCKRLETECLQLKGDVATLSRIERDKERLENQVLQLQIDVARLSRLEMLSIDQMQQTEEDPVIEELKKDKEQLEAQIAELQTASQVAHETKSKIQMETYCKQLEKRLNWERNQQGTQTDDSIANHIECEKQQTEMKEKIRIQKDENEAVQAAHKLISEKREFNIKMKINQVEKRNKTLKEAKKKLQAQGISSQLGFKKKVEELEEKLKAANSYQQLQAMSHDSLEFQLEALESELAKIKESLSLETKEKERALHEVKQLKVNAKEREDRDLEMHVKDLESELSKTKESLALETEQKEKAVREGLRLIVEHSAKVKQLVADAKEREEHMKLLLSGMTPNEFVAKHQQELEIQQRLAEAEMNKAYNQLSAIKDTNATLTKRCEDLKNELKEGSEQHQTLFTQHQETFSKLSQLQSEHRELKRNLQKTVSQLDKETAEKNNFARKLKLVECRLSERNEKSNEQKEKLSDKQLKKSAKMKKMLEEKSVELSLANAEKDNLKTKLKGLENDLDELKTQMDELAAFMEPKMALKGSEAKDLQKKLSLLEKENNRLKTKIQKTNQEESSQTDPNDLETEFQQLQKSLIDTQTQFCQHLSAKDEQIVAVNSQLAKTQQQLDRIKSALAKGDQ